MRMLSNFLIADQTSTPWSSELKSTSGRNTLGMAPVLECLAVSCLTNGEAEPVRGVLVGVGTGDEGDEVRGDFWELWSGDCSSEFNVCECVRGVETCDEFLCSDVTDE